MSDEVCCPRFDPKPWHDKVFQWENKKFIKTNVRTFMYMPLNFGGAMRKLDKTVSEAGAAFVDNMALSDHTSKWNMDVYAAVDRAIPSAENTTVSGTFYSRVYEGDFKNTGTWSEEYKAAATEKGYAIEKLYMWYTTCPKCAKKYGKNYVVTIAEIA